MLVSGGRRRAPNNENDPVRCLYVSELHGRMQNRLMDCSNDEAISVDACVGNVLSVVGYVRTSSDKAVTSLESTELDPQPAQLVHVPFFIALKVVFEKNHPLVELQPVSQDGREEIGGRESLRECVRVQVQ